MNGNYKTKQQKKPVRDNNMRLVSSKVILRRLETHLIFGLILADNSWNFPISAYIMKPLVSRKSPVPEPLISEMIKRSQNG